MSFARQKKMKRAGIITKQETNANIKAGVHLQKSLICVYWNMNGVVHYETSKNHHNRRLLLAT